jgi:hypothetical protein
VTGENAGCSGFSAPFAFGFTDYWQGICLLTGSQIHVAPKRNGEYALDIKGIAGSLKRPGSLRQ